VGYKDSKGNPTVGYGHLIKKGESYKVGGTITEKQAKELFEVDMSKIKTTAEKKLSAYTLNENQNSALLDAAFNMGPGKLSQFNTGDGKFSGENFFFKFMGDGDGISKRRFGENLLYSEGLFIPFDVLKGKTNVGRAERL
jgi:lysozyme